MIGREKRKNSRNFSFAVDMIHVAVGILIVLFAIAAFLNPVRYRILFPAIFFLAGILNMVNGYEKYRGGWRDRKRRAGGIALMSVGAGLFLLCFLSLLTMWWR